MVRGLGRGRKLNDPEEASDEWFGLVRTAGTLRDGEARMMDWVLLSLGVVVMSLWLWGR